MGVSYEGFDLSVFLLGTGKRDYWIANVLTFPMYGDFKFVPLYEGTENYWRPKDVAAGDYTCANPDAKFPRIYDGYGNSGSNYRISDKYMSDASSSRSRQAEIKG